MDDVEILTKLGHYKAEILRALDKHGELRMQELRSEVGFPSGSRGWHPDQLVEWGLVEVVRRVGDNDERVFALTEQGQQFIDKHLREKWAEVPEDVEERLEQQATEIDELRSEVASLREELENVRDDTEHAHSRIDSAENYLASEYWDRILEEIDK